MNGADKPLPIDHDPAAGRFVTEVDGHSGYVEYQLAGGVMTIIHTIVPPQIGGRGIAAALIEAALQYARAQGLKVVPSCDYAAGYLDRHPQYADLRA